VRADSGDAEGWLAEQGLARITALCADPAKLEEALDRAFASALAGARRDWADSQVSFRDGTAAVKAALALVQLAERGRVGVAVSRSYERKVSVVLPTYNHITFLPQAVAAVQAQTYTDFEFIIVNDGSTDGTADFLATLRDPRIRVIHRENGGLPTALNTGFATARGEYRTWTSSDNFTAPSWLAQLVKSLDAAPATVGFAASGFGLVDSMGRFSGIRRGQNLALESLIRINPGIASFLYRSRVAEQVGDYDASLLGAEDWDMWLRILEVCDPVYVDDVVYYYRQHRDSMTGTMPDKIRLAVQGTLESLRQRQGNSFDLNRFYPRLPRATDRRLARWQAKGRLATMLTDSPYCPANWTLGLYLEALRERFSPELHQNLLLLLALHGAWDLAISLLDQVAAAHPEPQRLAQIRALLAAHDDSLLKRFSLTLQEAGSLAFELGR
jgi:glycosyltransferase involved in cell wall biosynthesis